MLASVVQPDVNSKLFARASLILIGLAWTLPFLQPYHNFPITSFYSEWLAFVLGLAAATLLLRKALWRHAVVPVAVLAPLGLIVVVALQVALGRVLFPELALTMTLYLLWAGLLILLGHAFRREFELNTIATVLAWCLLAGGLLSALAGLYQYFRVGTPFDALVAKTFGTNVYGNLGQFNHFAAYITLSLASISFLFCTRQLHGALAAGGVALLLLVLPLSGSRGPWIYLVALAVLAVLVHRIRCDASSRRLAGIVCWLLPGFIAAQFVVKLPFLMPAEGQLLSSSDRLFLDATGLDSRLQLWGEAWRMFLDAPVLGAGIGQFTWHHFIYQATTGASAARSIFNHSHNIVMQLLAETGIAGASVVVGAALIWIADLRRVRFDTEWWWLIAVLTVIGLHSMLEYPLWYSYFLGIAALVVGLGAARWYTVKLAWSGPWVVGLMLATGFMHAVTIMKSYRDFEALAFSIRELSVSPQSVEFSESLVSLHRDPVILPFVELATSFWITISQERLHDKLDLNGRAMRFAPMDVVVYRQVLLLAMNGDSAEALRLLRQAIRVYPDKLAPMVGALEQLHGSDPEKFGPLLDLASSHVAGR